jgi:lysozyme family protein
MTMKFDDAFEKLIGHEGGFTESPKDPGNWTGGKVGVGICKGTKFGISAKSYPDLDIKNLTLEQAKSIYRRDFWEKCWTDKLPECVRFDVFDAAVNSGVRQAGKFVQLAAGMDGQEVDGMIGSNSIKAVAKIDPQVLDKRISGYRLKYMASLKIWPDFGRGWAARIATNLIED